MKKLMYFAAALLVLVGCNKKDNALNNAPEGTPFEKGQKVTLTIGTGAQQGPNRVAGKDNTETNQIDFAWEEGDQILVKVGENTATFTLSSGAGLNEGVFAGEMPAGGSTFDIQYPTALDLTEQEYTEEDPIPADKMLFTATGCVLGTPAILEAQYAMVQLNLYGTDKTVGKIVFTDKTANPAVSYTLTCTGGKTIGTTSAEATPFYMVVPVGDYKFKADIYDNATIPANMCWLIPSAAQTFTAGNCLNMPAKEVKDPYNGHAYVDLGLPSGLKWATMNVGATTPEGYGDYFAWGETAPYYSSQDPITWKTGKETGYSWQSYCGNSYFTEWSTAPYDDYMILKPEFDAAHVNWGGNWRMPTKAEFEELLNNCDKLWTTEGGVSGYKFTSKANSNYIFLPAAGYRDNSLLNYVGSHGDYWSSSLHWRDLDNAYNLYFLDRVSMDYYIRCSGRSVRPVCE